MRRRELLRLLATGAALQLAPSKWFAFAREAHGLIANRKSLRTLDPHQDATIKALADMIIPRTDTPSASDAGFSDFIDLILTEWYEASERTHFVNGLAAVDTRTKTLFSKNFVDCSPDQKSEIMVELGAKMLVDPHGDEERWFQVEIATSVSLLTVGAIILTSIAFSINARRLEKKTERAEARIKREHSKAGAEADEESKFGQDKIAKPGKKPPSDKTDAAG